MSDLEGRSPGDAATAAQVAELLAALVHAGAPPAWDGRSWLAGILSQGDPEAAVAALVEGLRAGMPAGDVSCAILLQAATRLAQLPEDAPAESRVAARDAVLLADRVDRAVLAVAGDGADEARRDPAELARQILAAVRLVSHLQRALGPFRALPEPAAGARGAESTTDEPARDEALRQALGTHSDASPDRPRRLPDGLFSTSLPEGARRMPASSLGSGEDGELLQALQRLEARMPGKPIVAQIRAAVERDLAS